MWCVRKEAGRVRLYLVPSRPRFLSPARRAANLSAHCARVTMPPKDSTTTAMTMLFFFLSKVESGLASGL